MLNPELLEAVPLAVLTGLGAYGGFPQPPRWWFSTTTKMVEEII